MTAATHTELETLRAQLADAQAECRKQVMARQTLEREQKAVAQTLGCEADLVAMTDAATAVLYERDCLADKLARIELAWDECEGVPESPDVDILHRLIVETEPHVDERLSELRRQAEED